MLVMVEGKKRTGQLRKSVFAKGEKTEALGKATKKKHKQKAEATTQARGIAKTKNSRSLVAQPNSLFTGGGS